MKHFTLRSASTVLYATIAILWFAIPQSVSNWSRDYLPVFVQPVSVPLTSAVEKLSSFTGLPLLYTWTRDTFQSATKKQ